MSPIEECDIALVQVCGLEVVADALDQSDLVNACQRVLDGLLEVRIHLPLQRSPSCEPSSIASPSTSSSR